MNLQQIPSHEKSIRMMFTASDGYDEVECMKDFYVLNRTDEVEIDTNVWKKVNHLNINDKLLNSNNTYDVIKYIEELQDVRVIHI